MKRAGCLETTLLGRRVELETWTDSDEGPESESAAGEIVGVWLEREPGAQVSTPTLLVEFDDATLHPTALEDVTRVLPRPVTPVVLNPTPPQHRDEYLPEVEANAGGLTLRLGTVERDKFNAWFRSVTASGSSEAGVAWDEGLAEELLFALWEVSR